MGSRGHGNCWAGLGFSLPMHFRMKSGSGDWGSLTKAPQAERGGPLLPLQHVVLYRDFINTLPCLMLRNEPRVRISVLNTSAKSVSSSY